MKDTRTKILELAEQMVRANGYNGFSFREIATAIGIKSSSVHHHFATKALLAEAVAERYTVNFFAALGDPAPANATTADQLAHYCSVFKMGFSGSKCTCLCGVLSNERALLPDAVVAVVDRFVAANVAWLSEAFSIGGAMADSEHAQEKAMLLYCALEGAMGVSTLKQDSRWLETVSKTMLSTLTD